MPPDLAGAAVAWLDGHLFWKVRDNSCQHWNVAVVPEDRGDDEELTSIQRAQVADLMQEMSELAQRMANLFTESDAEAIGLNDFVKLRATFGSLFVSINEASAQLMMHYGLSSAQDRIVYHLQQRLGEPVPAAELGGVSCIWEWARRTRELDVEQGLEIVVGPAESVPSRHYMLVSEDADSDRARMWQLKNRIRRMSGSAQDRMLELLKAMHPAPVFRDDLDYVAKIRSRDRRKRDLEEAGWRIVDWNLDPLLEHGWYRLDSLEKGPPRAREHIKLREEILQSKDFTCEHCGYRRLPGVEPRQLQVHHIQFVRDGGNDHRDNLMVVCRPCHAGIHSIDESSVDDELLNPAADPLIEGT